MTQTLSAPARVRPGGSRNRRTGRRRYAVPYWLLLPAVACYGLVVIYPNLAGAVTAFTSESADGSSRFVGLANFRRIFTEPEALAALGNTLLIAGTTTVLQSVIGLALAVALNQPLRTRVLLRAVFFAPVLLPPVVVAFVWQYLLTPEGSVNNALQALGLEALQQNWLGSSATALPSVIAVIIWQGLGVSVVIFLAGLQAVPEELQEAAALDGASAWQRFRHVTLPLLAPATTVVVSITLISSLKIFDQVFVMTGGGPGYATQTMSLLMYKAGFVSLDFGYSTAIALVLTALVFVLAALQLGVLRRWRGDA